MASAAALRIRSAISTRWRRKPSCPSKIVTTVGYSGSLGRHYARLVNQNFLYDNTDSPVYAIVLRADGFGAGI